MTILRSSFFVAIGSAASRILGFARDILFAQALGAGPVADAFLAAFRLPNLVRRILAEGGLNPVLIPTLAKHEADGAARVAGEILSTCGFGLVVLAIIVEIGAGLLALVIAPGLAEDDGVVRLVAYYTRLGFPSVVGITLASIGAAILYRHRHYGAATFAPLMTNVVLTAVLVALPHSGWDVEDRGTALAVASTAAGCLQAALVGAALAGRRQRLLRLSRPRWTPEMRALLRASVPVLAASGAVQVYVLVATQIASFWPSGVSWLYYAERVMQLPLGLVAALGASVLLPELAALERQGDKASLIKAQSRAVELALLLALPAAAALAVLGPAIAAVLFERGAFSADDAAGTGLTLAALGLGLPPAALAKVLSQTLFARARLRPALLAALAGLASTAGFALALGPFFGVPGIAFGISAGCCVHAVLLVLALRRLDLWSVSRAMGSRIGRIVGASAIMVGGLMAVLRLIPRMEPLPLTLVCCFGLLLYAGAAFATGAVTRQELRRWRSSS
jgi:putative peptidoglycan lipid II flippase